MAIGQLGSAGEQFRDFLGGGQQDIGLGLQSVLSNYADPSGNFIRLNDRSQGLYQLSSSEYGSVFDNDAQNQYSETWYREYRAVLLLRAEALKKKLNRAYTRVLENSIYAPLNPDEEWAPGANRDYNDISADSPTQIFEDGSGGAIKINGEPVIPTDTTVDTTKYVHPEWFSGSTKYSTGEANAYDDIRRYVNSKYLAQKGANYEFDDLDGDGRVYKYNPGTGGYEGTTAYDGEYDTGSETEGAAKYYDLWRDQAIDLTSSSSTNGVNSSWYTDIAIKMNVPPSTDTTNFVAQNPSGESYYIDLSADILTGRPARTSKDASVRALLPQYIQTADAAVAAIPAAPPAPAEPASAGGDGLFTLTQKNALETFGGSKSVPSSYFSETAVGSGLWYIDSTAKFYDPVGITNQDMFTSDKYFESTGTNSAIPGITLNPGLIRPASDYVTAADQAIQGGAPVTPVYQAGFVDSWREARQLQKREAQVEAIYQAYKDGKKDIDISDAAKTPPRTTSYEEIMDQVFSQLDQIGGGGAPLPPGSPPSMPPGTPSTGNMMDNIMAYSYYVMPDASNKFGEVVGKSINTTYQHGAAYLSPGQPQTKGAEGSVYSIVYDRLAMAADPAGGVPGAPPNAPPPAPSPSTLPPPAVPGPGQFGSLGGSSELFTPIPVGASESSGTGTTAGSGQPNINAGADGVKTLNDTFFEIPNNATSLANVSKLFVGRQWDYVPGHTNNGQNTTDGAGAVKYDAETISSHLMIIPGWFYDASGDVVGNALVTLTPAIDGLLWQKLASKFGLGRVDDYANTLLGGPFFHVGGGSDSQGTSPISDFDGDKKYGNVIVSPPGIGMGLGGIYWGHTSAIGTIYKVEELMENSNGNNEPGIGFQTMKSSLTALASLGGGNVNDMSIFPNVGIAGFHADLNIPIPIPPPAGLSFLNVPMTTYGAASYDLLTDYMHKYLQAMRNEVLDSVSVYSYATSGGYAMDSYGMRGEYSFTEKPSFETLEHMPDLFGLLPVNDLIQTAVDMIGLNDYTINNYSTISDGLLGEMGGANARRHSMMAAEARELDTGAFFSTAAFMSQFQLNKLEYSYWSSAHQNEEIANMDTMRIMAMTGKEFMKFLNKTLFTMAGRAKGPQSTAATVGTTVLNFMLQSFQEDVNEALMWDLLLRDQNEEGFVTSTKITSSSLTSEGYDFIEDERKLFEYDFEETRKSGFLGQLAQFGMGSFELPNQVLNGMANTRRYKPYLRGPDGRAGRQGFSESYGPDGTKRVHELSNHAGATNYFDNNWNIRVGFWQDTGLGDINEVYVRTNTVKYDNSVNLANGISGDAPLVETNIDRYVGSHNRIIGRGYAGANPLNLQSFRTGYFADKYFGSYISEGTATDNAVEFSVSGGIDRDPTRQVTMTMHGGQKYYDRSHDYNFKATSADGTTVALSAEQALNPVFGGRMKLVTVDQNDPAQQLGASTENQTNALTEVLYNHMRVKADGSNANLVKEYRDAFNMGFLDDMFITASANATMGGSATSSIRLKFRVGSAADNAGTPAAVNLGTYEQEKSDEVVGTGTLQVVPGYLGSRSQFKNVSRAMTDIYLSSFFAFKRPVNIKQN